MTAIVLAAVLVAVIIVEALVDGSGRLQAWASQRHQSLQRREARLRRRQVAAGIPDEDMFRARRDRDYDALEAAADEGVER